MSSSRSPRSSRRWTRDDVQAASSGSPALSAALEALGVAVKKPSSGGRAKRRGVEVSPIIATQRLALPHASLSPPGAPLVLGLWFEGARLLTVNEMLSVLQTRKHETFRYKKSSRKMVAAALALLDGPSRERAWFDGPTRLTLFRQGQRQIDLDSLATVFKYAIDTLRQEKIIDDDNPEVIVEIKLVQSRGTPSVGMRLERLVDWSRPSTSAEEVFREWFSSEFPWKSSPLAAGR